MAKAVWSDTQVIAQLDSGYHLSGTNLTYGFPTDATWFPYAEKNGFYALTASQQTMATLAIRLWDDLIPVNFALTANGATATVKYSNTSTNIGYAHAYYPGTWSGASSIWFNSTTYGSGSGTNNLNPPTIGQWGWMAYVHETGHALGLSHPGTYNGGTPTYANDALYFQDSQQYTLMSYFTASNTGADWVASDGRSYYAQTPMIDDIMTIQAMYGVSTTTRTGDTVYGFNSNTGLTVFNFTQNLHPVVAIFDSAGNDTLDLSGFNTASLINLTPGSFSNADAMTYNISIARTAWIENAVGGTGGDTLIGNSLNNTLTGNAGNDSIDGGSGSDTAVFSGNLANYTIVWNASGGSFTVADTRTTGSTGTDTLTSVEYFRFADQTVAASQFQSGTQIAITATDASKAEGGSGSTPFTFTVTRTGDTSQAGSVNYAVTGNGPNAADAADFGGVLPSGTVSFLAGQSSAVLTINVAGDTVAELDEGFLVTISAASGGAAITTATAAGTILTDDPLPSLAIAATNAVQSEGDSGSTPFTFTVTRSGDTSQSGTVNYAVTGTGTNPANATDFGGTLPSGTVSFAAGQTSATITVNVTGDTTVEANETFAVTLSGATGGATITTATATGTIQNNDGAFNIAAASASKAEGNGGSTPFTFTVTRTGSAAAAATVNWAVTGGTATVDDFGGALPFGTLNFAAGQTSATITVNVAGDTAVEGNETFTVTLSSPTGGFAPGGAVTDGFALRCACPMCGGALPAGGGVQTGKSGRHLVADTGNVQPAQAASIGTASATGTILNDDASLSIAPASASNMEGSSGTTAFTFTVTRTGDLSATASANWAVTGSGANPANGADFGGTLPSGVVSFAANQATATITVNVAGDSELESDEGFTVTLSGASGATIGTATASGTILNDDTAAVDLPVLAVAASDAAKAEGASGTTAFTFTVTRSGDLSQTSSASWTVTGTGAGAADAADFGGALPTGVVTFAANQASATITVNVSGDTAVEADEGFTVTLSNASGATIGTASATGAILNDDASLAIAADSSGLAEGNAGTTPFTFTVTRTGSLSGAASATWAVGGAGVDAADFGGSLPAGVVNFADGQASATITVNVTGDDVAEGDEAFTVTLSNAAGATIGTATAGSSILNDDLQTSFAGTAGNDVLDRSAMTQDLVFDLSQGGNDTAAGGSGDDSFNLGAAFTAADVLNGGAGTDTLFLDGNYGSRVTLGTSTLTNVERIVLAAGNSYNLTTSDATVAAGAVLTVDAGALASVNAATVNGTAETNGQFVFLGGAGADRFTGGAGNDVFTGGLGADVLTGGNGVDLFVYASAADSPFTLVSGSVSTAGTDQLASFQVTADKIDLTAFGFTGSAANLVTKSTTGFTTTGGTGYFSGVGVAVEYSRNGNNARVYVDVDKDNNLGNGDLLIQLSGASRNSVTSNNFVF